MNTNVKNDRYAILYKFKLFTADEKWQVESELCNGIEELKLTMQDILNSGACAVEITAVVKI